MSCVYFGFLASSNTPMDQICILSAGAPEPCLYMSTPGRTETITLCNIIVQKSCQSLEDENNLNSKTCLPVLTFLENGPHKKIPGT